MAEEAEKETGYNCEDTEILFVFCNVLPKFADAQSWASVLRDDVDVRRTWVSVRNAVVVHILNVLVAVHINAERVVLSSGWARSSVVVLELNSVEISGSFVHVFNFSADGCSFDVVAWIVTGVGYAALLVRVLSSSVVVSRAGRAIDFTQIFAPVEVVALV